MSEAENELFPFEEELARHIIAAADAGDVKMMEKICFPDSLYPPEFHASILPSLIRAFGNEKTDCVDVALQALERRTVGKDGRDVGIALLRLAAVFGTHENVQALIKLGVDVNGCFGLSTPLHAAARFGRVNCLRALLNAGADPNLAGPEGLYFPMVAVRSLECVELLVEHGADVNVVGTLGETPLINAIDRHGEECPRRRGESYALCKFLLEHGAKIDHCTSKRPVPALTNAVLAGSYELVELLIRYGADVNATGSTCITPISVAARYGHPKILKLLLQHGADARAARDRGKTLLHIVASSEKQSSDFWEAVSTCIRLLVDHNADPDAMDNNGRTPLGEALMFGNHKMIEALLKHGAKLTGQEKYGRSALNIARENRSEVGAVFRAHFLSVRLRKLRGIFRFVVVASRYRESFYRHKYVFIGAKSFSSGKRKLREVDSTLNVYKTQHRTANFVQPRSNDPAKVDYKRKTS